MARGSAGSRPVPHSDSPLGLVLRTLCCDQAGAAVSALEAVAESERWLAEHTDATAEIFCQQKVALAAANAAWRQEHYQKSWTELTAVADTMCDG